MKMTTNFLFKTSIRYCCLWIFMAFVASTQVAYAQGDCAITVRELTNLSLDNDNCIAVVTPDMVSTSTGCTGNIVRLFDAWDNEIPNATVTSEYVGQQIRVQVINPTSGNYSTGHIRVEDKIRPTIACGGNIDLYCYQVADYTPIAMDNCNSINDSTLLIQLVNEITVPCNSSDAPLLRRIVRSYVAVDQYGNYSDTCQVTINILESDLDDIVAPAHLMFQDDRALDCHANFLADENGNPRPDTTYNSDGDVVYAGTGLPTLNGATLSLNPTDSVNQSCNLMLDYTDKVYEIGCVTKIVRSWQILEWSCGGEQQDTSFVQIIEIADTLAPEFDAIADFTVSTLAHKCAGLAQLPPVDASDKCSSDNELRYNISWANGSITTNGGNAELPLGANEVVYRVEDKCGNAALDTVIVTVVDLTPPQPICKQFITVTLSNDGLAKVPATAFDNGSWDECNFDKVLVRRMNTTCQGFEHENGLDTLGQVANFYEYIHFCCSDITAAGNDVMVVMRAYDHAGNYNDCMVSVDVQNKIAPVISCPDDMSVTCDFVYDKDDLAASFGSATVIVGACGEQVSERADYYLNQCNIGTIVRTFYAQNSGGIDSCKQVITLGAIDPFNDGVLDIEDDVDIFWPKDTVLQICGDPRSDDFHPNNMPEGYGFPTYRDGVCALVGADWDDEIFTFNNSNGNACAKIVRTWKVIDWCQFSRVSDVHFYVDVRRIRTALEIAGIDLSGVDLRHITSVADAGELFAELVTALTPVTTLSPQALEALINGVLSSLYLDGHASYYPKWTWTQIIKIHDTIAPVITGNCDRISTCTYDAACQGGNVTLTQTATDECTSDLVWRYKIDANNDGKFDIEKFGTGNTVDASGVYPVGSHRIQWIFEDKCGNQTSCDQLFDVINCKTPSPYGIQGLAFGLMPVDTTGDGQPDHGMVEVWASDFDNGSAHPCGYKVYLSFERVTELDGNGEPVVVTNKVFTCADEGLNTVQLYAVVVTPMDSILQDFVDVTADIQDNQNICPGTNGGNTGNMVVSGNISTSQSVKIKNVSVALLGSDSSSAMTNDDGTYAFNNAVTQGSYIVKPSKDDDYLNGVNTLDIALIQRHILELNTITNPYKLLAADANNDGEIKSSDLLTLRKLILGLIDELPNTGSWRFIDEAHTFVDASNPFGNTPSTYEINSLDSDMTVNFLGYKVGDINNDALINGEETSERNANAFNLATNDVAYVAGQTVTLPITAASAATLYGAQFTMNFEGLEFVNLASDLIKISEDNVAQVAEGTVTFSWNAANAVNVNEGDIIATVTLNATEAGAIANAFAITSNVTLAQAYDANFEAMDVNFEVTERSGEALDFVVYQNKPNPFSEFTNITFDLPEASVVSFKVFDLTGKVVTASNTAYEAGSHVITVNTNTIENSGIYYYQIEAGKYTATKKMVVIK